MLRRFDTSDIAPVLGLLGVTGSDGRTIRHDAGETAFVLKQLEYVSKKMYETKYPAMLGRQFIPVNTEVPTGAQTWSYKMWDSFGAAKIIHSYADDLPLVGRTATEFVQNIRSIGDGYGWSIQDIRSALYSNVPLQADLALAARRAAEIKADELLAVGSDADGIVGFLNNPNVPDVSLTNGAWAAATAAEILADLHQLANSVAISTYNIYQADTLLLDTTSFHLIATKPMSDLTGETVLSTFLKQSPYVRNVDQWWRLDTAASGGTPLAVAYARSPEVLEAIIPQEFEQFPPQPKMLTFFVPCHMRCGGTVIKYPIAVAFTDDHA